MGMSQKGYLLRLEVAGFLWNLLDDRLDLVEALLDARHEAAPRRRALLLRHLCKVDAKCDGLISKPQRSENIEKLMMICVKIWNVRINHLSACRLRGGLGDDLLADRALVHGPLRAILRHRHKMKCR